MGSYNFLFVNFIFDRPSNNDNKICPLKITLSQKIKYLILILIQIQKNARNIFLILSYL